MAESERHVRLFRNGRNQALRIPREFELDGDEAIVREEGDRLIIEPARKGRLLTLLASLEPLEEQFPDVDEDLAPWATWNSERVYPLYAGNAPTISTAFGARWNKGIEPLRAARADVEKTACETDHRTRCAATRYTAGPACDRETRRGRLRPSPTGHLDPGYARIVERDTATVRRPAASGTRYYD